MTPMMSAMRRLLALISSMVATTWPTTWPPRWATWAAELASWLAVAADSALWRTVPVSCSMELAVCCRLDAASSVRWLRSVLPLATSPLATWMLSDAWRTCPTLPGADCSFSEKTV